MGTKLTGQPLESLPVVGVTQKVGGKLTFILNTMGREVKLRKGKGHVYEGFIEDVDGFPIEKKNEEGKYVEVGIDKGDKIAFFAPTVLHGALQKAAVGDKITLEYLGKKEGKNSDYHDFDVEKD